MPKNGMPRTTPDLGTGTPVHRQYPPGPRLGPATAEASPGTPEFAARRERLRLADGERARVEVAIVPGEPGSPEQARDLQAAMEPRFPKGTPEYAAYEAELREELGKFARGEEPYPYEPRDDSERRAREADEIAADYAQGLDERIARDIRLELDETPFGPQRDELIAANLRSTYLKARGSSDGQTIHEIHTAGLKAVFELGLAWGHADERDHGGTN